MSETLLCRHLVTLDALEGVLARIPEAGWTWRADEDSWCAAEIFDHVGRLATGYGFPRLEACLEGRGERGGRRTFAGWLLLSWPSLAGAFRLRQKFPPELRPQAASKAEAAAMLRELRRRAEATAPRLAAADPELRVKHVRLGWLNASQWFAFAEVHARHHLRGQLRRLLAHPAFPPPAA
jgi:hypothetical protein